LVCTLPCPHTKIPQFIVSQILISRSEAEKEREMLQNQWFSTGWCFEEPKNSVMALPLCEKIML